MRRGWAFNRCATSITKGMPEKQGELNSKIPNNSNIIMIYFCINLSNPINKLNQYTFYHLNVWQLAKGSSSSNGAVPSRNTLINPSWCNNSLIWHLIY